MTIADTFQTGTLCDAKGFMNTHTAVQAHTLPADTEVYLIDLHDGDTPHSIAHVHTYTAGEVARHGYGQGIAYIANHTRRRLAA